MVVAAGHSRVAGYFVATASAVSYGQLLTNFRQAGISKVSSDGSLEQHLCYALQLVVSPNVNTPQSGDALWQKLE